MGLIYKSIPISSAVLVPPEQRTKYFDALFNIPKSVQKILFDLRTSAYIRGLAKSYDLPPETAPSIAFAILRLFVGEITLSQLPSLFSTELRIANDKAQKIAQEIERDLFAPVALELNQYLAQKKKSTGSIAEKLTAQSKQNTSLRQLPHPSPLLGPPVGGEGGTQGKFPRRPAAPPNILNLKDQRPGPKPPPIPY